MWCFVLFYERENTFLSCNMVMHQSWSIRLSLTSKRGGFSFRFLKSDWHNSGQGREKKVGFVKAGGRLTRKNSSNMTPEGMNLGAWLGGVREEVGAISKLRGLVRREREASESKALVKDKAKEAHLLFA